MKEIIAYIRRDRVEGVHAALAKAGFDSMTIVMVEGTGGLQDPARSHLSLTFTFSTMPTAKVELMSKEEDVDRTVCIIREHAKTGYPGDGIIVVSPVERAIRIRTGEEGPHVL